MNEQKSRGRRAKKTASRIVVFPLVGALVLFFGPAVAFGLGNRAEAIDNRPLAAFPSITEGWNFLPGFQAWANDYLPLRAQAVSADTLISQSVFGEAPSFGNASGGVGVAGVAPAPEPTAGSGAVDYPQVIEGKDGYLFLGGDASAPCQPTQSITTIHDGFQKLADAATKSGRKLVIAIAPDKSSAHPEFLPDTFAGQACMEKRRGEFWDSMKTLTGLTVVDPSDALAEYEKKNHRSVWRKLDTHWAPEGAGVFASQIVSAIEPSLLDSTKFATGPTQDEKGDLAALLGQKRTEPVVSMTTERPGVQLSLNGAQIAPSEVPALGYSPIIVTGTSTGAPLYQSKAVLLGDSFFDASRAELAPFFSSLSYVHNMSGDIPGATDTLATQLPGADTIIYEMVERSAVSGAISYQEPKNVDALAAAMLANPLVPPAK